MRKGCKLNFEQRQKISKGAKKSGVGNWMLGRKLTLEHKKNIGIGNFGRKHSNQTKQKISIGKLGIKNPMYGKVPKSAFRKGISSWNKGKPNTWIKKGRNVYWSKGSLNYFWKGGVTPQNKILRTKFRIQIVPLIFKRDNYTCQICFIRGQELHVDHIKKWSDYPELRFDPNNCRTLCKLCHYRITFGKPLKDNKTLWGKHRYV